MSERVRERVRERGSERVRERAGERESCRPTFVYARTDVSDLPGIWFHATADRVSH